MVFNSLEFLLFFPLVVAGYFAIPHRHRWILLLAASYYFYMCWKLEYVVLILISTAVDYIAGIKIENHRGNKPVMRAWLIFSLLSNLGMLFAFKYFNFFSDNLRILFNAVNLAWHIPELNLLLPVGISFYTFQTLSYTIEVYRGNYPAERHPGYFALFVAYFPQLVAGPIERPGNLLPQLRKAHTPNYQNITDGLKLMAWGFFKKLVIADRIALMVDPVYADPASYQGLNMLIPTMLLHLRVYCDFSAYSDIAIGAARIMGVQLSVNFDRPMFAVSFRSFWRKWHITLTRWVMDYLFKPLITRVNHWGSAGRIFAILVSFTTIGLWHGAAWGMVLFGLLNGLLVASESVKWPWQRWMDRLLPLRIRNFVNGVFVFTAICLTVVCFGAGSLQKLMLVYHQIFAHITAPVTLQMVNGDLFNLLITLGALFVVALMEFLQKDHPFVTGLINRFPWWGRWAFYLMLITLTLNFGLFSNKAYIYFQF